MGRCDLPVLPLPRMVVPQPLGRQVRLRVRRLRETVDGEGLVSDRYQSKAAKEVRVLGLTFDQMAERVGDTFIDWKKMPPARQWEIVYAMISEAALKGGVFGAIELVDSQ